MKQVHTQLAAEKEARKHQKGSPFRFWVPVGETREIIIVDDQPEFFRHEHALHNPQSGRRDIFVNCINEFANCPVCSNSSLQSRPYFAMYLTVIDTTPYQDRDGNTIEWSKKLLVIKPSQQPAFTRLFERNGTMRGMVLEMTRDGDKDPAIGNDINHVGFAEEDELQGYYREYEDKDGNVHEIVGEEPFNYEEIMPELTERQLAAAAGVPMEDGGRRTARTGRSAVPAGRAPAGRTSTRRNVNTEDLYEDGEAAEGEETAQEAPVRGRAAPATGRGAAASRRPARVQEEEEVPEAEEEEEAPAPVRGRGSRASPAAPARGAARTGSRVNRAAEVEEEDEPPFDLDGSEEEAPAPAARGRAAPAGRAAPSAADRRAQLRGGRR